MRNNGLPFSIRNWVVEVLSRASVGADEKWLRVKGLNGLTYEGEAEVKDGSSADDGWKEPYVSKRGAKLKLSGRPVANPLTGEPDPGQMELDYKSTMLGFEGDATLRLIDPYGHALRLDVVVTDSGRDSDEGGETRSWSMELVGEPVEMAYVQLTGIAVLDKPASEGGIEQTEVSIGVNQSRRMEVGFAPADASNRKFSVASADAAVVKVRNVDQTGFELLGVSASGDEPVRVVVRSMNNALEKVLAVRVS